MSDLTPVKLRIYDPDRRGFEEEKDYPDLDILTVTAIEKAMRRGRSVQLDPIRGERKP